MLKNFPLKKIFLSGSQQIKFIEFPSSGADIHLKYGRTAQIANQACISDKRMLYEIRHETDG